MTDPARRAAVTAWLEARHPELAPLRLPETVDLAIAGELPDLAAAAVIDQARARIELVAHAEGREDALVALLVELRSRGVREALLRELAASDALHGVLLRADLALVAETVVVRRTLSVPPQPRLAWRHRSEGELGEAALGELIARAMTGTVSRYLDPSAPVETLAKDVPAAFRRRWWTAAELDGELVGVVLPRPEQRDGVTMAFIGLIPEVRGRRWSGDLLADALARLAGAGARWYIDETDVSDLAAQRMFAAAGCSRVAVRRLYRAATLDWQLRSPPDVR